MQGQAVKDPWALPSSLDSVLQTGGNHKRSLSMEMAVKRWFGGREPKTDSQSVVPRPAACASPEDLSEMQIPGFPH